MTFSGGSTRIGLSTASGPTPILASPFARIKDLGNRAVVHYQEAYFLVATLYPLAESGSHRNLGATLRAARTAGNSPGIDRRMEVLLEADVEQLPFRLRQAVRFAQSNRVPVNWRQLLRDVLWWEHPDRFVQRQWAEAYFGEQVRQHQRP